MSKSRMVIEILNLLLLFLMFFGVLSVGFIGVMFITTIGFVILIPCVIIFMGIWNYVKRDKAESRSIFGGLLRLVPFVNLGLITFFLLAIFS